MISVRQWLRPGLTATVQYITVQPGSQSWPGSSAPSWPLSEHGWDHARTATILRKGRCGSRTAASSGASGRRLSAAVSLVTFSPAGRREETAMTAEGGGYFVHRQSAADEACGMRLSWPTAAIIPIRPRAGSPTASIVPRPCSSPQHTAGRTRAGAAWPAKIWSIYELHVGTFTPEGTFDAIIPRLPQLLALGVTAIELMPVAQFAGQRELGLRRRLSLCRAKQLRRAPRRCNASSTPPIAAGWP